MNETLQREIKQLDPEKVAMVIQELTEPRLKKTEVDICYGDFKNWERSGLLYKDMLPIDGKQYRMSYIEYVWIRIVDRLLNSGYDYESVNLFKRRLVIDDYVTEIGGIPEVYFKYTSGIPNANTDKVVYGELLMATAFAIITGYDIELRVYDQELRRFPHAKNRMLEFILENKVDGFMKDSLSISFKSLIHRFYDGFGYKEILSDEVQRLLIKLRNKRKDIKVLRFDSQLGVVEIDITKDKLVDIENTIFTILRSKLRSDVYLENKDGDIVEFEM